MNNSSITISDKRKNILDVIANSPHASLLHGELYNHIYGKSGPSISSYCGGKNSENICGCWVHQLIDMINR